MDKKRNLLSLLLTQIRGKEHLVNCFQVQNRFTNQFDANFAEPVVNLALPTRFFSLVPRLEAAYR